jgi:hypothetical protein
MHFYGVTVLSKFGKSMSVQKEKLYYLKLTFLKVWMSYVLFILLFTVITDLIRNMVQGVLYYVLISIIAGFVMAIVEALFFRVVIKIPKERVPELERLIHLLAYRPVTKSENRTFFQLSDKSYFFRKMDLMISEEFDFIFLNINVFHSRYSKRPAE